MGELYIWQRLKGLSLGLELGMGGGGEGSSLKEPQHLFWVVKDIEGRAEQLPPPRQSLRLRLILFHTVGNPHYPGAAWGGGQRKSSEQLPKALSALL